jgi:hypothetical protein
MADLSELRRAVIEQIQSGKMESLLIAEALNEPLEDVNHVVRVLAGEDWFKLDDATANSLDIYDVKDNFQYL